MIFWNLRSNVFFRYLMFVYEMVWNLIVKKVNVIGGFINISSGVEKRLEMS